MSVRMIFRSSIDRSWVAALLLAYRNSPSIPFWREAEIGQAALGARQRGDLRHLVVRELEIEDLDVFRQALDAGGPRDRSNILLHEPAQTDLRRRLAVRAADRRKRLVGLDAPLGDRAVGDQCEAVLVAGRPHLRLVEIGVIF